MSGASSAVPVEVAATPLGAATPAEQPADRRANLSSALAAAAAVLLAASLLPANGAFHPLALAGVTVGLAASCIALVLAPGGVGAPRHGRRWALAVLAVGVGSSLVLDLLVLPGLTLAPARLGPFAPLVAVLAVLAATHAWEPSRRVARVRFAAELAVYAALGALVLRATPVPPIDVWFFERIGASALLDGVNPYLVAYPNIYGPGTPFLAAETLSPDGRFVLGNPYPPLTLLLVAPAVALTGDPRWAMLAAMLFAAWAIRRLGRGSAEASLAALFLLVQPRGLFVLEQSWTEPLVLALVLGTALAVSRLRERLAPGAPRGAARAARAVAPVALAAAGALAIKQYAFLVLVPLAFAVPRGARRWSAALAVTGAVAVTVPFVAWDPESFVQSVVLFHLSYPFRVDALSWTGALFRLTGTKAPGWIPFVVAAAVVIGASWRRVTTSSALLAGAVAWTALVVLGKQAFCNYYWLSVGLLCAAVAAAAAERPEPPAAVDGP